MLYIHGGPTSASLETFTMPAQIFAAQGWLVFEPITAAATAKATRSSAACGPSGAGPGRDVMAGIKAIEGARHCGRIAHRRRRMVVRRVHDVVAHRQLSDGLALCRGSRALR